MHSNGASSMNILKELFQRLLTHDLVVRIVLSLTAVGALLPAVGEEPRQVMDTQTVLANAEKAFGGAAAIDAIKSLRSIGEIEGVSGFPGTFVRWQTHAGKMRTEWDIRYINQIRAFDGVEGREKNVTVREIALGPDFEFATNDGADLEDYVGFGRSEIVSPADGTVVYVRNDIPDGLVKADYLKRDDGIMRVPKMSSLFAVPGMSIVGWLIC